MNRPVQIVISIVVLIAMFVLGLLIPNQFNDKGITNDSKKHVEEHDKQASEKSKQKAKLPQHLTNDKFKAKYEKQSNLGKDFVDKYFSYTFKDPDENYNEASKYIDEDYKKERDLTNDETDTLMKREVSFNSITPVQSSSNKNEVTFKYDVDLKETFSKDGFNKDKAKKDKKYLDKVKTEESTTNKVVTVKFSLKTNKIINLDSNYL